MPETVTTNQSSAVVLLGSGKPCVTCGLLFPGVDGRGRQRKFCSQQCAGKAANSLFIRGHRPWNYKGVSTNCRLCGKRFRVSPYRLKNREQMSCSKQCNSDWLRKRGVADTIIALYNKGQTAKEIATTINKPVATVYTHINRRKYRFRQDGESRRAITRKFLSGKTCLICGWDRCLDAAHIIPASKGGTMEEANLLPLCPNHHRLFDRHRLSEAEAKMLASRLSNYGDYVCRIGQ